MNQPWLTTMDCPVNAFEPKEARNKAVSATSSTVRSGYATRLPPMAEESLRLIEDGGIANYTRRVLAQRRATAAETLGQVTSAVRKPAP